MKFSEAMKELKSMGTAQNRKIYGRHGGKEPMFGVSFANLKKLKKSIKTDHGLAQKLWASRNLDARLLATMIANPEETTKTEISSWVKDIDSAIIGDLFSSFVSKTTFAIDLAKKWQSSKKEYVKKCGYSVISAMLRDKKAVEKKLLITMLKSIEKDIHNSPNRARQSMNVCLITIGLNVPTLRKKALAHAKKIGQVHIDHGETSCKTDDAVTYLTDKKILARYGINP